MVTRDEKLTKLSQHHGLKDVGEVTLGHVLVENVDFVQKFAKLNRVLHDSKNLWSKAQNGSTRVSEGHIQHHN